MLDRTQLRNFAKAALVGTLAGVWLPTLAAAIIGLSMMFEMDDFLSALGGAIFLILIPSIVALCIVLPSMILIGLPATALLTWLGRERAEFYMIIGIVAGAAVVIGVLSWFDVGSGWWMIALGMFSGGFTGWTWGIEREFRSDPSSQYE